MNYIKKICSVLLTGLIIISLINLAKNGKCLTYTYVWYFNTDKDTYYNDETIYINASWNLEYNDPDISFIQIRIFNESWDLLWNSPEYHQSGNHLEGEWYVKISDLNLPFNNTSNDLKVVFYYYLNTGSISEDYVEVRYIQTIKRDITCELTDFTPSFTHGEVFDFIAKFHFVENKTTLSNYIINVKIKSNNKITFDKNFTTNSSGFIYVLIPNDNLTIGKNILLFSVIESIYHYNLTHEYQLMINTPTESSNSNGNNSSNKDISKLISSIISVASILSVLVLFFLYVYYNKKKIQMFRNN